MAVGHGHPRLEDRGAGHEVGIETVDIVVERRQHVLLRSGGGNQGEVLQAGLEEVVRLLQGTAQLADRQRRIEGMFLVTWTAAWK